MTRTQEKLVKGIIENQQEMNALTQDKINEISPKAEEKELTLSKKEQARIEGIPYIEPKRRLPGFGKLPDKLQKDHARDWEYVKGIFENEENRGEAKSFWLSLYPGDPDCLWEVPANIPVYVPRMVANVLSGERGMTGVQSMVYHTFDYIQKSDSQWKTDDFTHNFSPTGMRYRGKFRPIGAFA